MLKNFIVKCAETLNRDDICGVLKFSSTLANIEDGQVKNDIIRLISYYNYISKTIFEDYVKISTTEAIVSDQNCKVGYFRLHHVPTKINKVYDKNMNEVDFETYPEFLKTNHPNKLFYVDYNYIFDDVNDLQDKIHYHFVPERIFVAGVVSEFLASKSLYGASEFWNKKFLDDLFSYKYRKERRLKSTFCKWKKLKKVIFIQTKN